MRFIRFDDNRSGLITDRDGSFGVLEIGDLLPDGVSWEPLIEDWEAWKPRLKALLAASDDRELAPLAGVRLRPPLPMPCSRIFALGLNFASHVGNASKAIDTPDPLAVGGEKPLGGFFVIPGTVVGHEDEIRPPARAAKLDYEAEVAVVLASGGLNVGPEAFRIWGHTAYNDLSIRDPHLGVGLTELDKGTLSWALQKNFQGGNVCGPWLTVDEGYDYANLPIASRVNGEQRQSGSNRADDPLIRTRRGEDRRVRRVTPRRSAHVRDASRHGDRAGDRRPVLEAGRCNRDRNRGRRRPAQQDRLTGPARPRSGPRPAGIDNIITTNCLVNVRSVWYNRRVCRER